MSNAVITFDTCSGRIKQGAPETDARQHCIKPDGMCGRALAANACVGAMADQTNHTVGSFKLTSVSKVAMLFKDKTRSLDVGKPAGMGPYTYLDQSARPEAEAVRQLLDAMLLRYPADYRTSLAEKLRSDDEDIHNAAFFEVLLHELMVRRKYEVVAIEAEAPGKLTRPDFLFRDAEGTEFYLEATLATGVSVAEKRKDLERRKVIAALNEVKHPRFLLEVRGIQLAPAAVGLKAVQNAVIARLDQLAEGAKFYGKSDMPLLSLNVNGLALELRAVERDFADTMDRPGVSAVFLGLKGVRSAAAIRKKVRDKASRYGDALGRPFFIAVNSTQVIQRDEDFEAAMFGTLQFTWQGNDEDELQVGRARDGALIQGAEPRYSRVTGIVCFYNLTPWTVGTARARVLENPFAERPYDMRPLGLPLTRAEGNDLETLEGSSVAKLLDLPPGWPSPA